MGMTCGECRDEVSARLDDEDNPALATDVDTHLDHCADCAEWAEAAARVTRLGRTSVAEPVPDLVADVLRARPRRPTPLLAPVLRLLLALLGMGQIALAIAHFLGAAGDEHQIAGATVTHLVNEFAAWNLAVGVGFLWVALRTHRAVGLVPTLGVFVVALTAFEVYDLIVGHVDAMRVLSHGFVQIGLIVMLALQSRRMGGDGFAPGIQRRRQERETSGTRSVAHQGRDDGGGDGASWLRPTARRDAA